MWPQRPPSGPPADSFVIHSAVALTGRGGENGDGELLRHDRAWRQHVCDHDAGNPERYDRHIHMLVSAPAHIAPSKLVQYGLSARREHHLSSDQAP
jgi:hypothetical protein